MKCPACDSKNVCVLQTRGDRRRRECGDCRTRWTTVEVPENIHFAGVEAMTAIRKAAARLAQA